MVSKKSRTEVLEKKQNVKSKEDKMHFSIFYPGESNGTSFAFYEVDCMVVGYSKNKAVPW